MKKILDFCEKYAPEILVLLLCIPVLIMQRSIDSYHTSFYFTDYSTGFGGKKLLGEICSLWFPEIVRKRHIFPLIYGVLTLMIGLFAWFTGKSIRQHKTNQFAITLLIAIYLLSPYSFIGIINSACVDFYLCTATLCFLYLYIKHRGTWYYYLFTLFLVCIACLTHHIFCNIYFPLIFALFIYDIFVNERDRKKNIALYSAITLCLFGLFCAIAFFSTMNIDFVTYYQQLQTRTTESISALSWDTALYYEFYAKLSEHVTAYVAPIWKYNIARFVFTLIVFAPLWVMLWTPWLLAIKNATTKSEKWCYILMQVSLHLIILPAYIMAVDYQRWTFAYCFCQVCLFLVVYSSKENAMKQQFDNLVSWLNNYKVIFLICIIYICSFDLVDTASAAPIVDRLCELIGLKWQVNEVLPVDIATNIMQ